jgi:hypothetical protein
MVLADHYRCFRSFPTPRYFSLGQSNLVIGFIVFPFIAALAYLIFQGQGMAQCNVQRVQQAREDLRRLAGSTADEIEKLDRLKNAGSISDAEFTRLRARLLA